MNVVCVKFCNFKSRYFQNCYENGPTQGHPSTERHSAIKNAFPAKFSFREKSIEYHTAFVKDNSQICFYKSVTSL